ncbi:MAG: hypothetical protein Q9226_001707 [Calogaya cf. arnoldii]
MALYAGPLTLINPHREFRVLVLFAGTSPDVLRGEVVKDSIDDVLIPYTALSYTWGDPSNPGSISLNGGQTPLPITRILEAALRQLRSPSGSLQLWVDAISDPIEKNAQKGFQYKLPDGYDIERSTGTGDLYPGEVFGAILVAMLGLAYENYYNQTDPFSHFFFGITLKITGADDTMPFYRQFASYTLYHTLQTITAEIMTSEDIFTATNFTLQNKAGAVACRVIFEARVNMTGTGTGMEVLQQHVLRYEGQEG